MSHSSDPTDYYWQLPAFSFHSGLGLWIAANADAAAQVLDHPQCLVRPSAEPVPRAFVGTAVGRIFELLARMSEGERHRQARGFVVSTVGQWSEEDIVLAVDDVWRLLPQDAHSALWRLPVSAVARLMGFDVAEAIAVAEKVEALAACIAPGADVPAVFDAGERAAVELWRVMKQSSEEEFETANRIGIVLQACEASAGYIGTGAPSVHNTRRFVAEDVVIQGTPVPRGSVILVLLAPIGIPLVR